MSVDGTVTVSLGLAGVVVIDLIVVLPEVDVSVESSSVSRIDSTVVDRCRRPGHRGLFNGSSA